MCSDGVLSLEMVEAIHTAFIDSYMALHLRTGLVPHKPQNSIRASILHTPSLLSEASADGHGWLGP